MKAFLIFAIGLALIVVGYYIYKSYTKEHKLARLVSRILEVGFIVLLANFVMTVWGTELVCRICYCVYFIATDWLVFYVLKFSILYVNIPYKKYIKEKVILAVISADSLSVALNFFIGHLFTLRPSELEGFFRLDTTPFFYIHYMIILLLALCSLIALGYRSITAPAFYRTKYILIAGGVFAIVIINIFSFDSAIDYSIIGYAIEGIFIYHCAFAYYSRRLILKTLYMLTQDMSFALLILDTEGKQIYINRLAEELMNTEMPITDKHGIELRAWCQEYFVNHADDFFVNDKFFRGRKTLSLQIHYQRLFDNQHRFQGAYFLIRDWTEDAERLEHERYIAVHDRLTGLYNKEYFLEMARRHIDKNPNMEFIVVCSDIKDFKLINDSFGPQAGDNVLMNIAKLVRSYATENIVYGRTGSDVFAFLIPKNREGDAFFEKLTSEAFLEYINMQTTYVLANHFGVYEVKDRTLPVSVMCDRALRAIMLIKDNYQENVAYYDEKMRASAMQEQELLGELEEALKADNIQMYIQPQVTRERKTFGGEALVRWVHPAKGQILPGKFIPVLEQNGLISEVDKYIWEKACKQLKRWKEMGREDMYISVNISPKDFYFLDIYPIFTGLIEKYGIKPRNLRLEITESALSINLERQLELINKLRAYGFSVEMDDFGSGYSSLSMLKDTNVDTLKVDMGFLQNTADVEKSRNILEMIVGLCKKLKLRVLVEGVETAEQVRFLTNLGCDAFQGYYFARPMPLEEFEERYMNVQKGE